MKRYCNECKQFVECKKTNDGGLVWLIIFLIIFPVLFGAIGILLSVLILILYLVADIFNLKNKCPICGLKINR